MIGYPIVLNGGDLRATVVGGGRVALRKVRALLDAGATVRVIAREPVPELVAFAADGRVALTIATYAPPMFGDEQLVIAATDDRAVNASVAADAKRLGRWVNVVDAPEAGNCVTPAVHRAGDLVIGVTTGGVPSAAARIRDAIADRFDDRYATALQVLRGVRDRLLRTGTSETWQAASATMIGSDFCDIVETGELEARVRQWD